LGANNIEYLPPEIFTSLTKLRELQLYKNKIQVLPPEVGNLQGEDQNSLATASCFLFDFITAIQKISLASNNLKGLPDEIGACVTLEELYLSNNAKFSYFPGAAGHLRRLKELSLSKCPALKQLPNTGESTHRLHFKRIIII
jgi:Leucine-rich repeat (LRR) protein